MNFDPTSYDGYVFDCDGTLADSMPLHHKAWVKAFEKHAAPFEFTYEFMCSWGGKGLDQTVIDLNALHGTDLCPNTVISDQANFLDEILHTVQPIKNVCELAKKVAHFRPIAVASGGHKPHVLTTLNAVGLAGIFNAIVTHEDVANGKPAPDIYLLAAEKLGVDPTRCLAFEDSPTGIESAKAAGMTVIDVLHDPIPVA